MIRPLSSHEIQTYKGRMPTTDERRAFSLWRVANPNTCLVCGKEMNEPGLPGCISHAQAAKEKQAEIDRWKYLPASAKSFDDLTKCVGETTAETIKQLIADMIQEALHPENEE